MAFLRTCVQKPLNAQGTALHFFLFAMFKHKPNAWISKQRKLIQVTLAKSTFLELPNTVTWKLT